MRRRSALGIVVFASSLCCTIGAAAEMPFPVAAGAFRDTSTTPELVVVPAGRFRMGSTEAETAREVRAATSAATERPLHDVVVATPLAVGRFDVTVAEFDRFVRATDRKSVFDGCMVDDRGTWHVMRDRSYRDPLFAQTADHPAVCVTWDDAHDYAAWLSTTTGHRYRLLHEDEWEYAARAGTTTARWWGDHRADLCAHANGADQRFDRAYSAAGSADAKANRQCDDGYAGTNPGTAYPANPFGLHDMIGNAWQWVDDCFRETYDAPVERDAPCKARLIRGGSWHNAPDALRSAARIPLAPDNRASSIGFRVLREPDLQGVPTPETR